MSTSSNVVQIFQFVVKLKLKNWSWTASAHFSPRGVHRRLFLYRAALCLRTLIRSLALLKGLSGAFVCFLWLLLENHQSLQTLRVHRICDEPSRTIRQLLLLLLLVQLVGSLIYAVDVNAGGSNRRTNEASAFTPCSTGRRQEAFSATWVKPTKVSFVALNLKKKKEKALSFYANGKIKSRK